MMCHIISLQLFSCLVSLFLFSASDLVEQENSHLKLLGISSISFELPLQRFSGGGL